LERIACPNNGFLAVILKLWIALAVIAAAAVLLLGFLPGPAIIPAAAGVVSSPYCSAWKAVRDANVKVEQSDLAAAIRSGSRVVRREEGLKLWSTPDGEFWFPGSNDDVLFTLLAQQRRKIYGDAATGGVRKGDIVLDCGAHVGTYVRAALNAGARKVVAIEPSPEALACLRRNFEQEVASGRVVVYAKGVWDEEKRLVFYENGAGAAGDSFVAKGANAVPVADIPVTTIDNIVRELGLPRVDIIKADVKGAADRMIKGAPSTLKQFHPRIVVSTEEEDKPEVVHAQVTHVAPGYKFRAGPCLFNGGSIVNDTVFFQ
jgi:FkbM family methyltransferase